MTRYEVKSDDGRQLGTAMLLRYYGSTWRAILGRFNHRHDGYLLTLIENSRPLRIYRVIEEPSSELYRSLRSSNGDRRGIAQDPQTDPR